MVNRIFLALTLLVIMVGTGWGELSVSASRNQISINDSLRLEVVLEGDHDGEPDFSVLDRDFEIVGRSQSSQIQIINGDMSRNITWSLSLMPRHEGTLTIPPLCAGNDCSQSLTISVSAQSRQPDKDAEVLIEVEAQPADHTLVQGQVLYTVRLLHRQPLAQASLSSPEPQGTETLVQKLGDDQRSETFRNGWRYQVIERRYALFPQQSGKLHLPPLQFEAVVQGGRNPFDRQARVVRTRSNSVDLRVDPPESTDHPWIPAQAIRLEDDWQHHPPTLTVGEPATRTLTLRGAGVTAAQLPELPLLTPEGVKSYPDQPSREDVIEPGGVSGVLVQKVAFVPTHAGQLTLPPLSLWWWDLTSGQWRQETVPAVDVTVLPAQRQAEAAVTQPTQPPTTPTMPTGPEASTVEQQAIQPPSPATAMPSATPLTVSGWFWGTLICALGWLLTLLFWWRQRRKSSTAPAPTTPPAQPQSGDYRRQWLAAARNQDAHATYTRLCAWGESLGDSQQRGLEYWFQLGDDDLNQQLRQLSAHLYAPQAAAWESSALIAAFDAVLEKKSATAHDELPGFYPES